jgi:hypothetical protein
VVRVLRRQWRRPPPSSCKLRYGGHRERRGGLHCGDPCRPVGPEDRLRRGRSGFGRQVPERRLYPSTALLHASELFDLAQTKFAGFSIKVSLTTLMAQKQASVDALGRGILISTAVCSSRHNVFWTVDLLPPAMAAINVLSIGASNHGGSIHASRLPTRARPYNHQKSAALLCALRRVY